MGAKETLVVPTMMIYGLLVVAIVLGIAFLWMYWTGRRGKDAVRASRTAILGIASVLLLVVAALSSSVLYVLDESWTLEMYMEVTTDDQGALVVPVSSNSQLQESMVVRKGDASVSMADTVHGRALVLELDGPCEVYGQIRSIGDVGDWGLTMEGDGPDQRYAAFEPIDSDMSGVMVHLVYSDPGGVSITQAIEDTMQPGWHTYDMGTEEAL